MKGISNGVRRLAAALGVRQLAAAATVVRWQATAIRERQQAAALRPKQKVQATSTRALVFVLTILLATVSLAQTQVPDASQFVGAPQGQPLTGAILEQRTNEISALLRCPVCHGLAVADSHAEMAVNMKGQVRDLLARGYTEEEILSYFEQSYGQFVLLRPKFEGLNRLVWLLPVLALIIGMAIVVLKMKKLGKGSEAEDPYLAQVRELVGRDKP